MQHLRSPFLAGYLAAMLGLSPMSAWANPQNGNVAAGTAVISGQGTSHVIVNQSSDRAVINWQTFDIGAGERTQFIQPGASSIALNRVTGGLGPSTILGTIDANGRVFLVNPDGMLFGANAVINTAGFLATTHDITNADFMAGRNNFTIPGNPNASIVNLGTITATNAGIAALVAPGVRNSGTITAELGKVALASNNGFTLDFYGDKLITLQVDGVVASQVKDVQTNKTLAEMAAEGATDLALVKNEGTLRANGGRVELTAAAARQVVDSVINNAGVVEANSVGTKNGMIVLGAATASTKGSVADTQKVKVSGTLSAAGKKAGEKGGKIQITGERIEVAAAKIDASGKAGGGTVLIGGDVGGGKGNAAVAALPQAALESEVVPTASTVTIDADTLIDVSATERGNGGKVVVWSDYLTSFAGAIQARGGALAGDGGFAEVSSKGMLSYNGFGDLRAPAGKFGTLLLDPTNLYIYNPGDELPNDANTSLISASSIANQLAASNVIVATGSSGNGDGNITVNGTIQWATDTTLTLAAYNDIYFGQNAMIANTGGGSLLAAAGVSYSGTSAWTTTGHGTIKFYSSDPEAPPIDWSQSYGSVYFAYNPEAPVGGELHKYRYEDQYRTAFESNVRMGNLGEFGAYMWVNTVVDLQNVSQNLSGNYVFANIDATSTAETGFTPIGTHEDRFVGRFVGLDSLMVGGLGGTIDGLHITSSADYVGLFGVIGAGGYVGNVELTNVAITATGVGQYVGALAGANYGVINRSYADGVLGNEQSPLGSGFGAFGGLVGYNVGGSYYNFSECSVCYQGGLITNSSASVDVRAYGPTSGYIDAGGLVGRNSGTIASSYATGSVSGTYSSSSETYLGGLVGWNTGGSIVRSFAMGAINGDGDYGHAGGLVGHMDEGNIWQSFALGAVTLKGTASRAGGLVGTNAGGDIYEAYALGLVSAPGLTAGALIGVNSGTVTSSYWNTETSGQSSSVGSGDSSGVTGLTLAGALEQSSYTDWNFSTEGAWAILNGQTTPFLQSIAFVPTVQPPATPPSGSDDPNVAPIQTSQYTAPTDTNQTTINLNQSSDSSSQDQGGQGGRGGQGGNGGQGGGTGNNPPPPSSGPPPGPGIGRTLSEQRFSGVPPLTETRFLPGEVVVQVSNTISPERIQQVARALGITLVASQAIDGAGRVVYRFTTGGGKDIRDVIRALEKQQIVASAQPNYVFGLARDASRAVPLPRPAPRRLAQATVLAPAPATGPEVAPAASVESTEAAALPPPSTVPSSTASAAGGDPADATGALPPSAELSSDLQSDMASRTTGLPTGDAAQYIIDKLRLGVVHTRALGRNVSVAVIDSEIDTQHPDLLGVVSEKFDATNSASSPHAHGTGMAGAIASHRRLLGIAPGVRILAVKAFDETNTSAEATSFQILKGIDWAIAKRVRIINMSFAGPRDLMLERALQKAYDRGIVLVAAAGNAGPKSPPLYPAADVNVIAVSASDYADKPFAMANRGRHIAVAAPGVDVLVPSPKGGYQLTTGTSVAAAHVSGVAALLLESKPTLTPKDVRAILVNTAKPVAFRGREETFGAGLVDPFQALSTLTARSVDAASASRTVQ